MPSGLSRFEFRWQGPGWDGAGFEQILGTSRKEPDRIDLSVGRVILRRTVCSREPSRLLPRSVWVVCLRELYFTSRAMTCATVSPSGAEFLLPGFSSWRLSDTASLTNLLVFNLSTFLCFHLAKVQRRPACCLAGSPSAPDPSNEVACKPSCSRQADQVMTSVCLGSTLETGVRRPIGAVFAARLARSSPRARARGAPHRRRVRLRPSRRQPLGAASAPGHAGRKAMSHAAGIAMASASTHSRSP